MARTSTRGGVAVQERSAASAGRSMRVSPDRVLAKYDIHPAANLFPMMSEDDLRQMADDIAASGLREPIWMYDGQVLDGRNRLVACAYAGVEPDFRQWKPRDANDTPTRFVYSLNGPRRHLTPSQRAAIAVRMAEQIKIERDRMREQERAATEPGTLFSDADSQVDRPVGVSRTPGAKLQFTHGTETPTSRRGRSAAAASEPSAERRGLGKTREQVAAELHVSSGQVAYAQNLRAADPEAFAAVERGELTLSQAQTKVVREAQAAGRLEESPIMPSVKARILTADLSRPTRKTAPPKERIRLRKFGKIESSRTTVRITLTGGNPAVIEDWLNRMQDDPKVLALDFEVVEERAPRTRRARAKS